MALFDRDNYDYGYRTAGSYRGYDRDLGYRSTAYTRYGAYDRDYGTWGAYDRNYKSRWETDFGDPFGDRTSRTPIRVMRGEYHGAYDRDLRNIGYDRTYTAATPYDRSYMHGVNYEPYYGRGYDWGYRNWGRRY